MMGLRPIKMPSAKERVAAELRKAILSRQMKEGEVLSLESVASQLNVSAMPVREAFQILARDGLIQLRKNKAAVVPHQKQIFRNLKKYIRIPVRY